jgi:hypothetical protein
MRPTLDAIEYGDYLRTVLLFRSSVPSKHVPRIMLLMATKEKSKIETPQSTVFMASTPD